MENPDQQQSALESVSGTWMIFVVDDDEDGRSVTRHQLKRALANAFIMEFGRGEDALVALAGIRPDLLVTDHRLTGRSGLELVREVRQRGYRFPIVMLSGLDSVSAEALDAGANEFVSTATASLGVTVAKLLAYRRDR